MSSKAAIKGIWIGQRRWVFIGVKWGKPYCHWYFPPTLLFKVERYGSSATITELSFLFLKLAISIGFWQKPKVYE